MDEQNWMCRTELLITPTGIEKLKNAKVMVVGLGGVGGHAVEQIARSGVGHLTIVDSDRVNASNKNRQIIALESTLLKPKTEVVKKRLLDINPDIQIKEHNLFINGDNIGELLKEKFDYVVDAIDTLTPKIELLEACVKSNTPVVSSMGSGARLDPAMVKINDIKKTHHCKLAYLVRKGLHRKGIYEGFKAVYSDEPVPGHALIETDGSNHKRTIVGTMSYMPAVFGCYCASVVIRELLHELIPDC